MGALRLNGWTGGQYSLGRVLLAGFVLARLLQVSVAGGHDGRQVAVLAIGCLAALGLAVGIVDRMAALLASAAFLVAVVLPQEERSVAEVLVILALLVHAALPPAPYGSWAARGRADPDGDWRFPAGLHGLLLPATVLALALDGLLRVFGFLPNAGWSERMLVGFELGFVLAAPFRSLRTMAWAAMLVGVGVYALSSELTALAWIPLLFLAFDPGWLPPLREDADAARPETLLYDGECGLCHRFIRFVLAEDMGARAFRFAPLQGATAEERIADDVRPELPDSVVLLRTGGALLVRSDAVAYVLLALGGYWSVLGRLLVLIPRPVRDLGYDLVARVRKVVFPKPGGLCPLVPPHLAERFLP